MQVSGIFWGRVETRVARLANLHRWTTFNKKAAIKGFVLVDDGPRPSMKA
jgi:hypothetical protein